MGIHLSLVDSPHKGPVIRKASPGHDVTMKRVHILWAYLEINIVECSYNLFKSYSEEEVIIRIDLHWISLKHIYKIPYIP